MDPFFRQPTGTFLDSKFFNPEYLFTHAGIFLKDIFYFIFISGTFKVVLSILAIFFLSIIFYTSVRLFEIRKKERKHLEYEMVEYAHHMTEKEKKRASGEEGMSRNELWNNILTHLFSSGEADWKLAIIEADVMLGILMDQLGFKGETLGDKLKSADQEKFPQLTKAWEVHTIRNRIAHEGSDFGLSLHEAKRVIALYEQIFRDFGYI
ncbi:MAG: hypothetical protein Q8O46_05400 [bacterium]|nr:hypothetical protein [bacterium]